MSDQTEATEQDAPEPKKRKLHAKPKCPVGQHGFHQYERTRETKQYVTSTCRLCGRVVRRSQEEIGR